nr:hypothetical protein [Mycolicibacterium sphagni]
MVAAGVAVGLTVVLAVVVQIIERLAPVLVVVAVAIVVLRLVQRRTSASRAYPAGSQAKYPAVALPSLSPASPPTPPAINEAPDAPYLRWGPAPDDFAAVPVNAARGSGPAVHRRPRTASRPLSPARGRRP